MAVQPMKAASAAVLIQPMTLGAVAGAGLVIGAFFLFVGSTGLVSRLARLLSPTVAAGLQLGLGLSLSALGIRLIEKGVWLGLGISALMLALMRFPRVPTALIAVVVGTLLSVLTGSSLPFPRLDRLSAEGRLEILLVTTRHSGRWIIPKGGAIKGLRPSASAAQEAYEEAGVRGIIKARSIGSFQFMKSLVDAETSVPCDVAVYPLLVLRQFSTWPEVDERIKLSSV